ncbi:hypothetical protein ACFLZA_01290 [Candidatus Neomarinimicrobiota bacterium]
MKRTFLLLFPVLYLNLIYSQSVEIKDSEATPNTLIQINDEGSAGSITIPDATSIGTPTDKLYNIGGSIFWNGSPLGIAGCAGGWTDDGATVRLSTVSDKVGIGTLNPLSKLSVGGDGNTDETIHAENTDITGYAVLGWAKGINGCGIAGLASNSGGGYGVYGGTISPNGYGGYFDGRGYFSQYVGIGITSPDEALHISGNMRLEGTFEDKDGQAGASGQVLTSTGSGTDWITLSSGGADGNTLDQAYDQGSAGAGRTIIADAGALSVEGTDGVVFSGTYGSGTIPATGSGTRMMWYPNKAAFRVGFVNSTQWNDANVGNFSTAMGSGTKASGLCSTAFGYQTTAQSDHSFVIGRYNVGVSSFFEIGNGEYSGGGESNAMTVLKNGKVGIKTHTPNAGLEVTHRDGVLFTGTLSQGTLPTDGVGVRMMWYPNKAAFRAGMVDDAEWDDVNIGIGSQAIGYNPIASGEYSVSLGRNSIASGDNSTAMGGGIASADYATAIRGTASANSAIAIGGSASTSGAIAIAGGSASGSQSIAIGYETVASQQWATAIGSWLEASGIAATAMGNSNIASGNYSTAMGNGSTAESAYSFVIGKWNVGGGSPNSWVGTDPLFEIGNGTTVHSNAMTVLKNGNTGINTATPKVALEVISTDAILIPAGTTAEQPSSLVAGMIRFNSETSTFEGYIGSGWVNLH